MYYEQYFAPLPAPVSSCFVLESPRSARPVQLAVVLSATGQSSQDPTPAETDQESTEDNEPGPAKKKSNRPLFMSLHTARSRDRLAIPSPLWQHELILLEHSEPVVFTGLPCTNPRRIGRRKKHSTF